MSLKIIMNQDDIERNELNVNAMGGTEMMQKALQERLPKDISDQFQIIPSRVRDIDSSKLPVLWLHDLAEDPESQHLRDRESRSRFKSLVFVSQRTVQYASSIIPLLIVVLISSLQSSNRWPRNGAIESI